jgi:hypothetical protein
MITPIQRHKEGQPMEESMTNRQRLEQAGMIPVNYEMTPEDEAIIASLTESEVDSLIALKARLGYEFLARNMPHCIVF